MDVTIYYTNDYAAAPGGIERTTTPLESGWDCWRAYFKQSEKNTDTWLLSLQTRVKPKDQKLDWCETMALLMVKCGSMDAYVQWLTKNVVAIEVDGRTMWANPSIGSDE